MKNIKHSCREGKDIYTLPHQDSVLSEIFVRPHLDDKGYIIEGKYCVNLDGDLKVYSLTSILTGLNEIEQYKHKP